MGLEELFVLGTGETLPNAHMLYIDSGESVNELTNKLDDTKAQKFFSDQNIRLHVGTWADFNEEQFQADQLRRNTDAKSAGETAVTIIVAGREGESAVKPPEVACSLVVDARCKHPDVAGVLSLSMPGPTSSCVQICKRILRKALGIKIKHEWPKTTGKWEK